MFWSYQASWWVLSKIFNHVMLLSQSNCFSGSPALQQPVVKSLGNLFGCKYFLCSVQTRDFSQHFPHEVNVFAKQATYFEIALSNSFLDLFYSVKLKIYLTASRGSMSLYHSDWSTLRCKKLKYLFSGSLIRYSKWNSPNKRNVSLETVHGRKDTETTEVQVCNQNELKQIQVTSSTVNAFTLSISYFCIHMWFLLLFYE